MNHPVTTYVQDAAARDELGLLAVLDALAEEERVSQRELAQRTGLTLKKVNYCLHELLGRGYVKFRRALRNPDKRVYLYVLTPAGLKAKSRLTYRFVRNAMGYYDEVEVRFGRCLGHMAHAGVRRVVLCGPSAAARIVLELEAPQGLDVVAVVGDGATDGEFHGVPVWGVAELAKGGWDGVLVTALGDPDGAQRWLVGAGVPEERIWALT